MLLKLADLLKISFRRSDIIARMGGDEFAVLAVEATGDGPQLLINRLRERIDDFNQAHREPYQPAVSIGMARHDGEDRVRLEDLLTQADAAMYEQKRGKRKMVLR